MAKAKELKFRVTDAPGKLGEITTALSAKKVNLRAINAWVEGTEGVIRLVADKPAAAKKILAAEGLQVEEKDVLELELPDKPGTLAAVTSKLGEAGINIGHVMIGTGPARKCTVFIGVPDIKAAAKAAR
jgi:hypothetical protein